MKLMLGFMLTCLLIGTIWRDRSPRAYLLPVLGLSILMTIGFFFFNQT